MLGTLNTLMRSFASQREEALVDHFAVDLLDQKIRDSETGLKAAKMRLAGLIQREQLEQRQLSQLTARIEDLTARARLAITSGAETLAVEAAAAIADLETEAEARRDTVTNLSERVSRLHLSLERAARRLADLRQAAKTARAVNSERRAQKRLGHGGLVQSPMADAEELVGRILGQEDPFETGEILRGIDEGISHSGLAERMGQAGFGSKSRPSAADVLERLKNDPAPAAKG